MQIVGFIIVSCLAEAFFSGRQREVDLQHGELQKAILNMVK
jgi:hypothetical protein